MKRSLFLSALCLSGVAAAQYPGASPVPEAFRKGFEAITIDDAKSWLGYLAGPECKGRGSGQPGFQKAAEFMAARFAEMGLKGGAADGSFFQPVPWLEGTLDPSTSLTFAGTRSVLGQQLQITGAMATMNKNLSVAFLTVGEGELPDLAAVQDRLVIVTNTKGGRSRDFLDAVRQAGAAFVLETSDMIFDRAHFQAFGGNAAPGGRLHPEVVAAVRLTLGLGETPKTTKLEVVDASKKAALNIQGQIASRTVPNVVAILEGSDEKLKGEYVGLGSHLDHLGVQTRNGVETVYWGADDDGSGSTSLLGTAKALTSSSTKPKRSIVFMAFCGEEMGLIGSSYFANNPTVPLTKMTCELQMDMVGRNAEGVQNGNPKEVEDVTKNVDTIRLVGSQRISTELHGAILDLNKYVNFQFRYDREDVYTRSDHYAFASRGVPIAFLFDGFHPDYHRPTDTVDKINFEKLTNSAKLFYLVALDAANRELPYKRDVPQNGGG